MRVVFTVLLSAMVMMAWGQSIIEKDSWIMTPKKGEPMKVKLVKDGDGVVYYRPYNEKDTTVVLEVAKSTLVSFNKAPIWQTPFKYNDAGQIEYQEVVEVPSASKNDLYNRARLWFADAYGSSKDVLELEDKEAGVLVGAGWSHVDRTDWMGNIKWLFWTTVKIEVKDGKYRYTINELKIQGDGSKVANAATGKLPVELGHPKSGVKKWSQATKDAKVGMIINLDNSIQGLKMKMQETKKEEGW